LLMVDPGSVENPAKIKTSGLLMWLVKIKDKAVLDA
jgi:hypothetical protein